MTMPTYEFDGLDRVEETMATAAIQSTPAYVLLRRIEGPSTFPSVGRREWNKVDMAMYLRSDDDEETDLSSLTKSLWDEPEAPNAPVPGGNAAMTEAEHRSMAKAMVRWMTDIAKGQMGPDASEVRFKVEMRSPKGAECLCTPRFVCRRQLVHLAPEGGAANLNPTIPLEAVTTPAPPRIGAIVDPGVSAWAALDQAIASLINGHQRSLSLLQAGTTHQMRIGLALLQDTRDVGNITTRTLVEQVKRMSAELLAKDAQIMKLADELISFRIDLAALGLNQANDKASAEQRMELAQNALSQVGKLGELYLAGKFDVDPAIVDLLLVVKEQEDLYNLLKDKRLPAVLKDPAMKAMFVDVLSSLLAAVPEEPTPTPTDKKDP